jgi:hypothetical protein
MVMGRFPMPVPLALADTNSSVSWERLMENKTLMP